MYICAKRPFRLHLDHFKHLLRYGYLPENHTKLHRHYEPYQRLEAWKAAKPMNTTAMAFPKSQMSVFL